MNIGVPKERRPFEFRVGLTPMGVQILTKEGHKCYVEHDAGVNAGFSDQEYQDAGATVVYTSHEVFGRADLLLKVARPIYEELEWLRPEIAIMGLLHLASSRQDKINALTEKRITAISYEQIQLPDGTVPVRRPLSQIGGHLVAQISSRLLQSDYGGKGILISGLAGVPPAEVVVIGAGEFGSKAVESFVRIGAHVTVLDVNLDHLQRIHHDYPSVVTVTSNPSTLDRATRYADVVVAGVFVPGERPPIVVTREMVKNMKPRALVMDISIDEGGCVETSRPTTHEHPTFIEEGVVHYCVPNIPSVVARTSSYALLNSALPYIMQVASRGAEKAIADNPALERGTMIYKGELCNLPRMKSVEYGA